MFAAYSFAALFRIALTLSRTGPLIVADEIGYLANARVLAGGPAVDLSTATFYYSGSSLFMVPAFWLTDDPASCYRITLVIQCLLSAAVLPLTYGLLRALSTHRALSLGAAIIASLAVDATFWSAYALSESALTALTVAWIWATVQLIRTGRARHGAAVAIVLGLIFGLLAASHSRGAVLVVIGMAVVGICARRISGRNLVACALSALIFIPLGLWLNVVTLRRNYPGRTLSSLMPNSGATAGSGLISADQMVSTLGQFWYLTVAAGTLGLYGLLYCWHFAWADERTHRAPRLVAASLVTLAAAAVAFGSAKVLVATAPTNSPDYLVYGRYIASCLPVLIAFGVLGIMSHATRVGWAIRGTALVVTIGLLIVVRSAVGDLDPLVAPRRFPIPAVTVLARMLRGDNNSLHATSITVVSLAIFSVCCALAYFRHHAPRIAALTGVTIFFAVLSARGVSEIATSVDRATYPEGAVLNVHDVTNAELIAWDTTIATGGVRNIVARMSFAYFAEDAELILFDSTAEAPPKGVGSVAATQSWDGSGEGMIEVVTVPRSDIAIWAAAP